MFENAFKALANVFTVRHVAFGSRAMNIARVAISLRLQEMKVEARSSLEDLYI